MKTVNAIEEVSALLLHRDTPVTHDEIRARLEEQRGAVAYAGPRLPPGSRLGDALQHLMDSAYSLYCDALDRGECYKVLLLTMDALAEMRAEVIRRKAAGEKA